MVRPELDDTQVAPAAPATPAPATPAPAGPVDVTATATPAPHGPPSGALSTGARLDHFRVEKQLGAGGMGEVYLATDLALDRLVAIKVLPEGCCTGAARDRLVREARAQAHVQHPNVAHIYFIGEDAGRVYFAMEYIKCGTLAERVANGPLPVEDALQLVHDAALGLREAHHAGFSHRDVKPSNLMVDGHGVVKVVDFGLVAVAPEAAAPDAPAAQTSFGGTPLYMAPEQARGEPIDLRADIYALGATLYHLVAGKPPFVADTVPELLTLHRTAARPSVPRKGHAKSSASAVDALVAKMMAPDPADRFASYDELLRALELASAAHTRPAGFWVRGAATAVDFTFIFAIVAAACAASGRSEVPVATYGISGLALLQLIGMLWRGTTPGKVVFELEVIDVATGRPPRPGAALARTLALYGGVVIAGWLPHLVAMPKWMESLLDFVTYGLPLFALVRASLRVAGKRTPWDRIAGTIVHYKTARQLATS